MDAVRITLRDGFLEVAGECPGLTEKLRYFRKEIKLVNYQRLVEKHFEDLFDIPEDKPGTIVTMPGFAHRVLEHCRKKRIPYAFSDARTPMPRPDLSKAFDGLRDYQIRLAGRMLASGGGILEAATGCLAKGTPVRMADGSIKPVEDVKPGDKLLAFDDAAGCLTSTTVSDMIMTSPNHSPKPMLEVTVNGERTRVTYDHPFFGGDGFYPLYQLVWGALEASQRSQLELLCEQYGAPFDDKTVWCKHSCDNVPCLRLERVLQDNAGWAYRESAQDRGGELAGESAWIASGEPYRLQHFKQQGGQSGMVFGEVQCVVWGNPWQHQDMPSPKAGHTVPRRTGGNTPEVHGEDWGEETSTQFSCQSPGSDIPSDTNGVCSGHESVSVVNETICKWPMVEIKEAEPYYTIRTREAPYTYCIGRRNCYLTHNCGKTAIAAAIIRAYSRHDLISRGTPTCVFACPDRDINRKNWQEFQRWLPNREIGLIMSGSATVPSDDVVCCTIDSLDHLDPDEVGILIVDEMHASASSSRSEKIAEFRKARRWGVSATATGRFDGADVVAEGLYGPIVAEFTYQDGVKSGALVPITVLWMDAPEPVCGLTTYAKFKQREAKMRHGSIANEDFAQLVADILNCTPDDMQTLCMLQFIEQMSLIHRRCSKTGYVHAETSPDKLVRYPDLEAIKPKERKEIYDKFHDREIMSIISTHCWKQGVDFPELNVVVNAGGGGSDIVAKQVPGRASRKADGKDHAYIVDFWHKWDREDPVTGTGDPGPLLSNDFSRRRAYKDLGFEQVQCPTITQIPFIDRNLAANTTSAKTMGRNLLL